VQSSGQHLIIISGTGEPDPELAAASTVSMDVLHQVLTYFKPVAVSIWRNFYAICPIIFCLTGLGFEPAIALLEHGIYHPDLPQNADINDWLTIRKMEYPSVGIVFYRAHWMSGNTRLSTP